MPLATTNPVPLSVPAHPNSANLLFSVPVTFVSQEPNQYRNFCWAACGAMILNYKGFNVQLSDVVSTTLGPNCTLATCDEEVEPWVVYKKFGLGYTRAPDLPLSQENVEELIRAKIPVEVYWKYNIGGSHVVLIVGLYADGDLQIFDPRKSYNPPQRGEKLPYDEVLWATGKGSWQDTLTNFIRRRRGS